MHRFASLTSRLVVTAVALVAVVSVLVGGATALAMRGYLTGQLDAKVLASVNRADGPGGPDGERPGPSPVRRPDEPPEFGNQEPGTLIAQPEAETGEVLTDQRDASQELSAAALRALAGVPVDGEVHAVEVSGHGSYRVTAAETDDGLLVTGLPTDGVDAALASLVWTELLLALLGVGTAAAVGTAVVRRQLRPLTEVAETAHAVAALPLDAGEVGVIERVPGHLTDERTEVGQVGAALNTLLAHVESSLSARQRSEQQVRQFVADASHELRTPLTTIAGYAELARRRPGDAAVATTALAKVAGESERMTALVEDLLLLARLDAGRPLERAPVDLTRMLVEAVADARVVAPEHQWRVVVPDESVEVPTVVEGDEQRLHQVVTNLLTNARKHTPSGTTVTVTARPTGFEVHDDGPGFPTDLVSHAFERFTRGDAARNRAPDVGDVGGVGGVGLGLALVQAIVTAHGGSVGLSSQPGNTRILVDVSYAGPKIV